MKTKKQRISYVRVVKRVNLLNCPVEDSWVLEQFKCLLSFRLWVAIEYMLLSFEKLDKDASLRNIEAGEEFHIAIS